MLNCHVNTVAQGAGVPRQEAKVKLSPAPFSVPLPPCVCVRVCVCVLWPKLLTHRQTLLEIMVRDGLTHWLALSGACGEAALLVCFIAPRSSVGFEPLAAHHQDQEAR